MSVDVGLIIKRNKGGWWSFYEVYLSTRKKTLIGKIRGDEDLAWRMADFLDEEMMKTCFVPYEGRWLGESKAMKEIREMKQETRKEMEAILKK